MNRQNHGHALAGVTDWVNSQVGGLDPTPAPAIRQAYEPFTRLDSRAALELGCTVRELHRDEHGVWIDTIPAEFEELLAFSSPSR